LQRARCKQIERIDRARRIPQNQRALAEVIRQQRRQHEDEPGEPDRPLAEMSHVGVKRLGSGDSEDYSAEKDEPGVPVLNEKAQAVPWIRRGEDLRDLKNLAQSQCPNHHEPDNHNRAEYPPDLCGAVPLEEEEAREYHDSEREHQVLRLWSYHFQAFHGAKHGDRRSDHPIAVEQCRSNQSQRDDGLAAKRVRIPSLLLKD